MSNENKIISNQAITNLMPVRDQDNKHAKKASDGTMSFMLWSIAGTALAACGGGGGGGGGGGSSGIRTDPPPPPPPADARADARATAIALSSIVSTLAEDTTARTKIADITITDRDGGSPGTLEIIVTDTRITSTDATAIVNMFQIIGTGLDRDLYLRADQNLDFETLSTLPIRVQLREDPSVGQSVRISVTDVDETGGGGGGSPPPGGNPPPPPADARATAIALSSIVSTLAEDTTARTKIADITITDRDGGSPGTLEIIVTDTRITSTDATAIVNMFQIIGTGLDRDLYLRADQNLDFETLSTLPIRVQLREDPSVGQSVRISVTDVDETSSAAGPLFSVTELREIAGTDDADRLENRARNAPNTNELIQGGNGGDRIETFGGADVVIGGAGEDSIFLGTLGDAGAETVVYRFKSDGSPADGNLEATDGGDRINNFERGVDTLVLVDVSDGTAPITSLADLIADPNDRLSVTVELSTGFINRISITFDVDAGRGTADTDARTIQVLFSNADRLGFNSSVSARFTDLGRGEYQLNNDNYGYITELFGGEDFFKVGDVSRLPDRFTILEGPDPDPGPLFSTTGLRETNNLVGTGADELIQDITAGSGSTSIINTNGGDDVVIGGLGADFINLGAGAETVVYRFESDGAAYFDGTWQGTDNSDQIMNFEHGVDKLVFVDVNDDNNGIPIANLGKFDIDEDRPEVLVVAGTNVALVSIQFANSVTIQITFSTGSGPTLASIRGHVDQVGRNYQLKEESSIAELFGGEDFFKVGDESQLPAGLDIM